MEYRITSGQISSGITLGADDIMTIFSKGTASRTTVVSGGSMMVKTGGSAAVTDLNNGYMDTEQGAYIQSLKIGSEGVLYLSSRVSVVNYISTYNGAVVHVYSGAGSGVGYTMPDYGSGVKIFVHSGGIFDATVRGANSAVISSGAMASNADCIINGNLILSGGTAINTRVYDSGVLTVSRGGVNSKAEINANGSAIVKAGGATYDDSLCGEMIVSSGGTAVRTVLGNMIHSERLSFGSLTILHGGIASEVVAPYAFTGINVQGELRSATFQASSAFHLEGKSFLIVSSGGRVYDVVAEGTEVSVSSRGLLSGANLTGESELTVYSGGTAASVSASNTNTAIIISSGGSLSSAYVSLVANCTISGGTATGVVIKDAGFMNLVQGKVSSSVVSYGGHLHVRGGSAVQTTISGGLVHVSGGIADGVEFDGLNSGILHVSSNGTATNVSVAKHGFVSVYTGGLLSGADVISGGVVSVSGGRAEDIRVSSGYAVLKTGSIDTTVVSSGGSLVVSGGTAAGATILSGGYAKAENGSANSVSVVSGGTLFVGSDAICTGISAESGAMVILYAGSKNAFAGTSGGRAFAVSSGLVSGLSVCLNTMLTVLAGASAVDCHIFSSGSAVVSALGDMSGGSVHCSGRAVVEGGQARAVSVLSGGKMTIKDKGNVRNIDVNGSLLISSGGYANNISVHSGGSITISEGGSANAVKMDEGAYLSVILVSGSNGIHLNGTSGGSAFEIDGEKLSGFSIRNGTVNVDSGGSMVKGTVGSNAQVFIRESGFASDITVSSGGRVDLSAFRGKQPELTNFASLNGARILSGGSFIAMRQASAGNVVLESGAVQSIFLTSDTILSGSYAGSAFVLSGGVASAYAVHEGYLLLDSGCSADRVTIHSGGTLLLYSAGNVTNATVSSGGMLWFSNFMSPTGARTASGVNIHSGGILYFYDLFNASSGYTSATGISADSGALLQIRGFNSMTYLSGSYGGSAFEIKDGLVSGYTVHSGGMIGLSSGCSAQAIAVESGGSFTFYGGTVSGLACDEGAHLILAVSNSTALSGSYAGSAFAFQNGAISSYQVHSGQLLFNGGCSANRIDVLDGGLFVIRDGSVGQTTVSSGGILLISSSTQINSVSVLSGGIVTGELNLTSASNMVVSSGGVVEFNIASMQTATYINDLSRIHGAPLYTLRLSNYDENPGEYVLAKNAAGFKETITVTSYDRSRELGTLTVGGTSVIKDCRFDLRLDGDALVLSVNYLDEGGSPAAAKSDIDGNGISDVMFVWTGNNYAHGYWMNGTSEWQSANSNHPAEWDNLGCYDMTGDGKADSVLFGNVTSEAGIHGAYIGYYADAIDLPDGSTWVNIGYLTNEDNIQWKNVVGNLTGNASGVNSIVWYAPELYALGAWTDGTENWVPMSSTFGGDDWTLVGCGDFDGDGKDSVLMSGLNGKYLYAANLDGTSASLGSANWSGWDVRAIGDFAGDDRDDIVAFHKETGIVAMWGDGLVSNWSQLGQLDATDWFVVGAGDYNGDQQDDLLVRQYSTGMLGYYASGDMDTGWVELGRGVDMDWTVIA